LATGIKNAAREYTIPIDLLRNFKNDVRTIPHVLPTNGWIVFDRAMLVSVLRGDNAAARADLAKQIEKLGEVAELVILAR